MKKLVDNLLKILFCLIIVWVVASNYIYAFKNPTKTQTQLFLHIPKTITGDFK